MKMPLKILHVTNAYPTSNIPIYGIFIKEQIASLAETGIQSDIFFINAREKGKLEYIRAFFRLRKLLKQYDLVHCHHVYSALVVLLLMPDKKVIVSFLSDGLKEMGKVLPFLRRIIYNFIIKRSFARIFKKGIPKKFAGDPYSFYLPNGVNTDFFCPMDKVQVKKELNLDLSKKYLLFVSFYNLHRKEKRYDIYKKVVDLLRSKYNLPMVEELLMVDVPRENAALYFNASDIHLLVSDYEGSPNSVKESLSCNIPVLSTNVGNVNDIISKTDFCHIADSNNPEKLAKEAYRLLTDEKKGMDLRKIIFDKGMDMRSTAQKLKNIYISVLNK